MAARIRLKRIGIGIATCICLAATGGYFLLPGIIARTVTQQLTRPGYGNVSVEAGRMSLRQASLNNLQITGPLHLHVPEIRIHYRLRDLLRLRVDRLEIKDLSLRIPRDFRPPPGRARQEIALPEVLPFNRVDLENAVIQVAGKAGLHPVRIRSARLRRLTNDHLHLLAQVSHHETFAELSAVVDPKRPSLHAILDIPHIDLGYWSRLLNMEIPEVQFQGSGATGAALHVEWKKKQFGRLVLNGDEAEWSVRREDVAVKAAWKTLVLALDRSADHPRGYTGRMAVEKLSLEIPSADMRLDDINGAVPLYWKAPHPDLSDGASLIIGHLRGKGVHIKGIESRLALHNRMVTFDTSVPLYAGNALHVVGTMGPDSGLDLKQLELPAVPVVDASELGKCFSFLSDLEITGTPSVRQGQFTFHNTIHHAQGEIGLHDVSLSSKQWDFRLEGIETELHVDQRGNVLTPEMQQVHLASLKLGAMLLEEGHLLFTVQTNGTVNIESISFRWGKGKLVGRNIKLKPGMTALHTRLEFEHIELDRLLGLAAAGKAKGSGSLSGYWNVGLTWVPSLALHLGTGSLEADPGGGWFKVLDAQAAARLVKLGGGDAADKELMSKIQRAVYDFQYDTLNIHFEPQVDGGVITRIHAEGEGPRGKDALRFGGLTFNIDGLDDLLQLMLIRSDEMRREMEAGINQALNNFLGDSNRAVSDNEAEKAMEQAIEHFF